MAGARLKHLKIKVPPELAGRRLDEALAAIEKISKAQARKLIVAGAVYLNGKRVRIASKPVIVGAQLSAYIDASKLETGAQKSLQHRQGWRFDQASILYEDEWLVAVNKPAGLPTQPTLDEARLNLYAAVQKFMRERGSDPGAYVGLHHRLDRDTSGVVLFTRRKEANAGVADLFAKHLAQKTYHALSTGQSDLQAGQAFEVRNFLKRLPGKVSRFGSVRSGGDSAHTDFEVLERFEGGALEIRCWPRTGRTHQIRVHLSELGLPIIGDVAYGGVARLAGGAPRLMLHAASIAFDHPMTGAPLVIKSPLPEDYLAIRQALKAGLE